MKSYFLSSLLRVIASRDNALILSNSGCVLVKFVYIYVNSVFLPTVVTILFFDLCHIDHKLWKPQRLAYRYVVDISINIFHFLFIFAHTN